MEKKACRVGKFNVVDIIAVILILLVVALAGWKLLGDKGQSAEEESEEAEMMELTYVVLAEKVSVDVYESLQAYIPGQLSAGGKMVEGHVTEMEKKPYLVLGADGQWVEDPDHVNLYFTIVTETEVEEVQSNKVGTQEVRIGKPHILKTEQIEFSNTVIVDAKWGE
ncbi:MAG: DUF4330 domain-containing protein [Ruminococcaceae bacterium]|nr:DUF4330 domain-containing protein [Oscillospiraceae bacterium]